MIQDKSMLVELTISKWGATKHDKTVSAEVEQAHPDDIRRSPTTRKRLADGASDILQRMQW